MSPSSGGRSGGVVVLQVLLAVLFLAIIGGTVGYLLGEQHNSRAGAARTTGSTSAGAAHSETSRTTTGSTTPSGTHCPSHTEGLADKPLIQVLHLHTTKGVDVWICQAADGTLYYQGRRAGSSDFQENVNALFLTDVTREGGEYVARNYNPADGSTTEYRVTPQRLITVYLNYASPRPNSTETAAS